MAWINNTKKRKPEIDENLTGKDKFDEEYLKENYYGVLGYIAIRLNLV